LKRLGELLSGVSGKLELAAGQERQRVLGEWGNLAGEEMGRLAQPVGFRKSMLILRAFHPAAAMEIRLRKKEILDRLNRFAGKTLFNSLRVICSGTDAGQTASER
jgi:hypothetical protein